LSLYKSLKKWQ